MYHLVTEVGWITDNYIGESGDVSWWFGKVGLGCTNLGLGLYDDTHVGLDLVAWG